MSEQESINPVPTTSFASQKGLGKKPDTSNNNTKTAISLPGYLYPARKHGALPETPAEKKARRRAEERKNKPRCGIVSDHATADWGRRQERLKCWGYRSKIVCPGKPDRHLLPLVHPDKVAHRSNGYNIARIHGIADMAKADDCIAAALLTMTLPGRMHSAYKGHPNELWDGSTPEDGRLYFAAVTKNIRQRFKRLRQRGVLAYIPWFYRAMEAHKDGTPHQHWVIFLRPGDEVLILQAIDAAYKPEDRDHARRRIKFEACRHFEGAQSYIRKYVTKNTKGLSPGFKNQRVWRSVWGIRAFGTSLGLRAGIYKLLRRFLPPGTGSDCPAELETGVRAARANRMCEASRWADEMGLRLVYEDRISFRGDPYKAVIGMVKTDSGEVWLKPKWEIESVFSEVVFQVNGETFRKQYNTLLQEVTDSPYCIPPLRAKVIDGKPIIPRDVFEELPESWEFDWEKDAVEWSDVDPDDPDDL